MSPSMNDDELTRAVRGIAVADPLPDVDPARLVVRGRRGVRRRRVLTGGVAALAVSAVAVSAALLPDIGADGSPPVTATTTPPAPTSSAPSSPPLLEPLPGVPRGDAAMATMTLAEATRRCQLKHPNVPISSMSPFEPRQHRVRVGTTLDFSKVGERSVGCVVPGDSRPTAAGVAAAKADPIPATTAGILRNCSVRFGHDLRGWTVTAVARQPKVLTMAMLVSPSGAHVATCELSPKGYNAPPEYAATFFSGSVREVAATARITLANVGHIIGSGVACDALAGAPCTGFLWVDAGRVDSRIVRMRWAASSGRSVDIPVKDGWFAVTWADGVRTKDHELTVTAYDAAGKVVGTN